MACRLTRNVHRMVAQSGQAVRHGHSLVVPYHHEPITAFKNGVPAEKVRDLSLAEKKWDFWTTSDAFLPVKPHKHVLGITWVPYGEVWVLKGGKVVEPGVHFLVPGATQIQAIKNQHTVVMGVVTPSAKSKEGQTVNAYAVVYVKVTDPAASAQYVDPETNRADSELAAAKTVRRVLEKELPNISVNASGALTEADKTKLAEKISSVLKAKAGEFGIEVSGVEIRGAFPSTSQVPDKLRALDPPALEPNFPGHGLSNDYWSDVLSPPFFQKMKFGSSKEQIAPGAVSLEWSIPSPPDYHHFNELPRMTALAPGETAVKAAH